MTAVAGQTFGVVGALAAFPRRLAAREVERQGGFLRRGVSRQTSHLVFGRKLLDGRSEADIEARLDEAVAAGREPLSENGFLRLLGLLDSPEQAELTERSLLEQSKLGERDFALLRLFDAFEHDSEPYSFRDLILSRKYAGLIAGGATWSAIARSVHRSSGAVTSLTALSLHPAGRDGIYARRDETLSELDGQLLLPVEPADHELEELFALAEEAEAGERYEEAAALYSKCLAADPDDSVAAFNRANCLRLAGDFEESRQSYLLAVKRDPGFVEAWFNFAGLLRENGQADAARRALSDAIARDGDYADAVYNLAALEFECENLSEARRWWARYLELDRESAWARNAVRGIQYVDMHLAKRNTG